MRSRKFRTACACRACRPINGRILRAVAAGGNRSSNAWPITRRSDFLVSRLTWTTRFAVWVRANSVARGLVISNRSPTATRWIVDAPARTMADSRIGPTSVRSSFGSVLRTAASPPRDPAPPYRLGDHVGRHLRLDTVDRSRDPATRLRFEIAKQAVQMVSHSQSLASSLGFDLPERKGPARFVFRESRS